jgi:hypothetical protein
MYTIWKHVTSGKAVTLPPCKWQGREDAYCPTHTWPRHWMGVSGQRHATDALYTRERTAGTCWIGGWVGLRAGLNTEAREKILDIRREWNPGRPVFQSVVRHYTDWSTPAPKFWYCSLIKYLNTYVVFLCYELRLRLRNTCKSDRGML